MTELELALQDAIRLKASYDSPNVELDNEQVYFEEVGEWFYVAVSGSNDLEDWIQNLTAWRWWRPGWWPKDWWTFHQTIPGTNYKATSGYVDAARTVLRMIEPLLPKDRPVAFSGHSKGGPVAAIAANMLHSQGYNIRGVRTFAAPRFSVEKINTRIMTTSRNYIAAGDVVPDYPKANSSRNWQYQGQVIRIGEKVDNHVGVIRDGIEAHLIPHYIESLEQEIAKS